MNKGVNEDKKEAETLKMCISDHVQKVSSPLEVASD